MADVSPAGAFPVASATVTLTSAQVLAIFTTPVTIVPAPGSGLALVPVAWLSNYTYGGTAYTDGGGNFQLQAGTSVLGSFATAAGFWTASASEMKLLSNFTPNLTVTNWANKAVTVQQSTGNPTLGNGTVTVTVAYMVVPVS